MTALNFDTFVEDATPADMSTAAEVGEIVRSLRGQRRALLYRCDYARDCRVADPDVEVGNQMEATVQNLAGVLYQLDKAIAALERVQTNLTQYPAVVERMTALEIPFAIKGHQSLWELSDEVIRHLGPGWWRSDAA